MIAIRKGVRSPYADKVDHLIKTTLMTNKEIAEELGLTQQYISSRRKCLKASLNRKTKAATKKTRYIFKRHDKLPNKVFSPFELAL